MNLTVLPRNDAPTIVSDDSGYAVPANGTLEINNLDFLDDGEDSAIREVKINVKMGL